VWKAEIYTVLLLYMFEVLRSLSVRFSRITDIEGEREKKKKKGQGHHR